MARRTQRTRRTGARKEKRMLSHGRIYIHATFNNTIVTITDLQGNAIVWASSGLAGFKGSRKSTPYAARLAAEHVISSGRELGLQEVDLYVKGPGPGREAAIRAIQGSEVKVRSISDVTPVPHNGCRPPKKRRV
ncbi:MAG: 30S ribosomal protein S11 [Chloroflexi bacterium RBG_16_48_8]|nr:MAG: 30S ribosomal protein S11 [Chloroflexi bacterium RBG_16_48_8]